MDTSDIFADQTMIFDGDDKILNDSGVLFSFANFDVLIDLCLNNIKYFERDNTTMAGEQFLNTFQNVVKQLAIIREFVTEFFGFLHEYDFDEMTPANGYRSIVKATNGMINYTTKLVKYITANRGSLLFRRSEHVK